MKRIILHIQVKPNAKQSKIISKDERGLIIALKARPQDGEANEELIAFLSESLGVPKSKIKIKRGSKSRIKQVEILGIQAECEPIVRMLIT